MRAFISHSSKDKKFVDRLASELGRLYCVYDSFCFESGIEFKESIKRGFDNSNMFVLLASQNSLSSVWVNFEIQEAEYRLIQGAINQALVYLIDEKTTISDLPKWLTKSKVTHQTVPQVVARDIKYHLTNLLQNKQRAFFIGRAKQAEELESKLLPVDGSNPPSVIFISGLSGIGRRSFIYNTIPRLLQFNKFVEFRIQEGDNLQDLAIRIADRVELYSSFDDFKLLASEIQLLDDENARARIMSNIQKIEANGEAPIFYDEGGMLDRDGLVQPFIRDLIEICSKDPNLYLFLVLNQRPSRSSYSSFPIINKPPLEPRETKRLIALHAERSDIIVTPTDISELAEYVDGYPPAVNYAIQEAKIYGTDRLLNDKSGISIFLTTSFIKTINDDSLTDLEKEILPILAVYSPLPLSVISDVIGTSMVNLSPCIVQLIDKSLIVCDDAGYYRISDPVKSAVNRTFGFLSLSYHEAVAKSLFIYLREADTRQKVDLSSVLFRSARLANNKTISQSAFHLVSDMINLAETLYHSRKYKESIEMAKLALQERRDNPYAREYLIRALIQEERWPEAEEEIEIYSNNANLYDVYYFKGFLFRKKGENKKALEAYLESINHGKKGAAVSRELAWCYYIDENFDLAKKHILDAINKNPDDKYLIDIWAKIATTLGDEESARNALARLETLDSETFYHHRLSCVEAGFGNWDLARNAAERACENIEKPPFEAIVQLVKCNIVLGDFKTAKILLSDLHQQYGTIRKDIQLGLKARLLIGEGKYQEALSQIEQIYVKNNNYWALKRDAIRGKIADNSTDIETKDFLQIELSRIIRELPNPDYKEFSIVEE